MKYVAWSSAALHRLGVSRHALLHPAVQDTLATLAAGEVITECRSSVGRQLAVEELIEVRADGVPLELARSVRSDRSAGIGDATTIDDADGMQRGLCALAPRRRAAAVDRQGRTSEMSLVELISQTGGQYLGSSCAGHGVRRDEQRDDRDRDAEDCHGAPP